MAYDYSHQNRHADDLQADGASAAIPLAVPATLPMTDEHHPTFSQPSPSDYLECPRATMTDVEHTG